MAVVIVPPSLQALVRLLVTFPKQPRVPASPEAALGGLITCRGRFFFRSHIMTKAQKILAITATASLVIIAGVAVLFTLLVGSCFYAAGKGIEEGEAQGKRDAEEMQRRFEDLNEKIDLPPLPQSK